MNPLLRKFPGYQAVASAIGQRIDQAVSNRLNSIDQAVSNQLNSIDQAVSDRLNSIEQTANERLVLAIRQNADPALFRMAESWASSLQPGAASPGAFLASSLCRMEDMQHPRYRQLCHECLKQEPVLHRKQWEFIFIIDRLSLNGCLREGAKGLGFGVGEEPLSSYFASKGCTILATDAPECLTDDNWRSTAQHAANKISIWHPALIDREQFEDRCSFLPLDMNSYSDIPEGYDFHWSSCVIEHLGGIKQAIDFITESVERLAPGGTAVHTTEFNLSSDIDTIDAPGTCILRGSDLITMLDDLSMRGFEVDPLILDPGSHPYNFHVDTSPFRSSVHLRLQLERFAATSVGLLIKKPLS